MSSCHDNVSNIICHFDCSVFVHRCGRTARIGNFGQALLYLLPSEESFVDFLTLNQSIVLETIDNELLSSDAIKDVIPSIKELALKDRYIYIYM